MPPGFSVDSHIHVCVYVCMYACMHVCVYACMYVCVYVCIHVRMYVCMCVCVCDCLQENRAQRGTRKRQENIDQILKNESNKPTKGNSQVKYIGNILNYGNKTWRAQYLDVCVYVCVYVCMHVCVCMYVYMYVCMYVYMYVCICVRAQENMTFG